MSGWCEIPCGAARRSVRARTAAPARTGPDPVFCPFRTSRRLAALVPRGARSDPRLRLGSPGSRFQPRRGWDRRGVASPSLREGGAQDRRVPTTAATGCAGGGGPRRRLICSAVGLRHLGRRRPRSPDVPRLVELSLPTRGGPRPGVRSWGRTRGRGTARREARTSSRSRCSSSEYPPHRSERARRGQRCLPSGGDSGSHRGGYLSDRPPLRKIE
jgi:hypothetical protein